MSTTFRAPLVQAPAPGPGAGTADSASGWFLWLSETPGAVEVLLAVTVIGITGFLWWRLARLVGGANRRQAVADYLLGVEQALHGDLHGAHDRLQRVVAQDPENHYARLLLGKVLAELGEPEQAHQQHLYLQRAFGVDSGQNELLLAQSLLAAGLPAEAAAAADRLVRRDPEHAAAWDLAFRAHLQCGEPEAAAAAGKRLLALVREGQRAAALRAEVAQALAQAGLAHLRRGDHAAANTALQQAQRLAEAAPSVPLLEARLQAATAGVPATVAALLGDGPTRRELVAVAPAAAGASGLPVATLAGLVPPARWACRACEAPLGGPAGECPRCGSRTGATLREPTLVAALDSPTHTMDAVDENEAYVRRIVRQALDEPGRPGPRAAVLQLGAAAVPELLGQAWQASGERQDEAIGLLRALGPAIAPALFAASDELEQQRLLPIGARSPAALVGRVVQGFDLAALPHFEPLFASAKPDHRKILIDFFLGLHDLQQFQIVLERFPPLEILHRMNRADGEVLRRFLQVLTPGHFVAETLLREPTFDRDADLLAAIPGARHPEVLEQALLARASSRTLVHELLGALGDERLGPVAGRLLLAFGEAVVDHVIAAFTDPERGPAERARLAALLTAAGPTAVEPLCLCFGPEPLPLDDDLLAVIAAMGDAAVPPLQAAYGHSGWVERITIGLISRHTNRRVQIVRTLAAIGSGPAAQALRDLLTDERDANLRLRLQQALHGPDPAGGGDGTR